MYQPEGSPKVGWMVDELPDELPTSWWWRYVRGAVVTECQTSEKVKALVQKPAGPDYGYIQDQCEAALEKYFTAMEDVMTAASIGPETRNRPLVTSAVSQVLKELYGHETGCEGFDAFEFTGRTNGKDAGQGWCIVNDDLKMFGRCN